LVLDASPGNQAGQRLDGRCYHPAWLSCRPQIVKWSEENDTTAFTKKRIKLPNGRSAWRG